MIKKVPSAYFYVTFITHLMIKKACIIIEIMWVVHTLYLCFGSNSIA